MTIAIANPTIRINQQTITYVPNSLTAVSGRGTKTVRSGTAGGGATIPVVTDNAESKIGAVTFSVYAEPEMLRDIVEWQNSLGGNTIEIIGNAGAASIQYSFAQQTVTNDPDLNLSADGVIELEFMGAQAAIA